MAAERFRPALRMNERSRLRDRNMTCWQSVTRLLSTHNSMLLLLHSRNRPHGDDDQEDASHETKNQRQMASSLLSKVIRAGGAVASDSTLSSESHHEKRELKRTDTRTYVRTGAHSLTHRPFLPSSSLGAWLLLLLFCYGWSTWAEVMMVARGSVVCARVRTSNGSRVERRTEEIKNTQKTHRGRPLFFFLL